MNYPLSLLLVLFFVSLDTFAQDLVLSGKVADSNSSEVIPFANLRIQKKNNGTVTNEHGEFELHLAQSNIKDTLIVSCIGYNYLKIPISTIIGSKKNVLLQLVPRSYGLNEVVIKPNQGPTAADIVQKALEKIGDNYLTEPILMDGFYREYFEENGSFVGFAEAAVSIYDATGYAPLSDKKAKKTKFKDNEIIAVNQLRVSDIRNQGDYVLYIDLNYALRSNLLRNANYWQEYANDMNAKTVLLNIDKLTYLDKDMVYIISYNIDGKRAGTYKGRLFIRANDYAVLRVEIDADNSENNRELNGAPNKTHAILTYQEQNGKWCLNYINAYHEVNYVLNDKKYALRFHSELTINRVESGNVQPLVLADNTLRGSIFYQPRYRTFDPEYWVDYQLFESSPKNRGIIADLEKPRLLDQQYRANGKLKSLPPRSSGSINNSKTQLTNY